MKYLKYLKEVLEKVLKKKNIIGIFFKKIKIVAWLNN